MRPSVNDKASIILKRRVIIHKLATLSLLATFKVATIMPTGIVTAQNS